MSTERIKGYVAFFCDLKGCDTGLETERHDFRAAADEAKAAGWLTRKRDDGWKNFCCAAHEEMDYRGQSLVTTPKET